MKSALTHVLDYADLGLIESDAGQVTFSSRQFDLRGQVGVFGNRGII